MTQVKHGVEVNAQYFAPLPVGGIFEGYHRAWVFHTIVPADAGIVHQTDKTSVCTGASDQFICRSRQSDIPGYRDDGFTPSSGQVAGSNPSALKFFPLFFSDLDILWVVWCALWCADLLNGHPLAVS